VPADRRRCRRILSVGGRRIVGVLVVAVPTWGGAGRLRELDDAGRPAAPVEEVADLAAAVAARERAGAPRWLLPSAEQAYPPLLAAGARVGRCHDLALTEALLLGHAGQWGAPRSLAAGWARLHGLPVPADAPVPSREVQPALFEPEPAELPGGADPLAAAAALYADQQRRIAGTGQPGRLRLLAAAESSGALVAAEMAAAGLPWRPDRHDELLTRALGPRPAGGAQPPRLAELSAQISAAFGGRPVNPDSPAELIRAFARDGVELASTRSFLLRQVDHPAVPLVLAYKELARLHAAHGWSWLEAWVHGGRFRPEYVVGGVVSGRWASRGGGALQIPRVVRRAVVADPGWALVVADAGQLEPRVLAAVSADPRMVAAAGADDIYGALAEQAFDGDRARAKLGLLSAMYGGTTGGAAELLAVLRRRFPAAMGYVEAAARAGEEGRLVRTYLGRTCPPAGERYWAAQSGAGLPAAGEASRRRAGQVARARGRFTRNFVIQGTAAEWALVLLAALRRRLAGSAAELVFFQHDEVVVHCPAALAADAAAAVGAAGAEATRLVFGDTPVQFPLGAAVVDCYADAK
jgi:DNA polymerase I